jgi:ResB-like family.
MQRLLKYLSFGLLAVLIVAMMAATILEKIHGTPFAFRWIYHNPLFIVLWAVVAIAGLIYLFKYGTSKKVFTMCLHLAFVLILAGALVTHLFGESGSIHLRQDMTEDHFELDDGGTAKLPFSIRLDKFDIDFHSGSKMPSDYRSAITFSRRAMNMRSQ